MTEEELRIFQASARALHRLYRTWVRARSLPTAAPCGVSDCCKRAFHPRQPRRKGKPYTAQSIGRRGSFRNPSCAVAARCPRSPEPVLDGMGAVASDAMVSLNKFEA